MTLPTSISQIRLANIHHIHRATWRLYLIPKTSTLSLQRYGVVVPNSWILLSSVCLRGAVDDHCYCCCILFLMMWTHHDDLKNRIIWFKLLSTLLFGSLFIMFMFDIMFIKNSFRLIYIWQSQKCALLITDGTC